jgi:hypothetical protein
MKAKEGVRGFGADKVLDPICTKFLLGYKIFCSPKKTSSEHRPYMEVCGQPYGPPALSLEKELHFSVALEAEWA